jgi:hypothetical protein
MPAKYKNLQKESRRWKQTKTDNEKRTNNSGKE